MNTKNASSAEIAFGRGRDVRLCIPWYHRTSLLNAGRSCCAVAGAPGRLYCSPHQLRRKSSAVVLAGDVLWWPDRPGSQSRRGFLWGPNILIRTFQILFPVTAPSVYGVRRAREAPSLCGRRSGQISDFKAVQQRFFEKSTRHGHRHRAVGHPRHADSSPERSAPRFPRGRSGHRCPAGLRRGSGHRTGAES